MSFLHNNYFKIKSVHGAKNCSAFGTQTHNFTLSQDTILFERKFNVLDVQQHYIHAYQNSTKILFLEKFGSFS